MKICISADSTCDLPKEFVEKYDIRLNAMPFSLGENDLRHDGVDGTSEDVFEYVKKTGKLPTTSAYNEYEYTEHFKKIKEEYDAIIHFSFSWDISSTGLNARRAAEKMENVFTIDTQNLSCGISLLILECQEMIEKSLDIKDIIESIEKLKKKVQASFVIDTLKYLHKGGRCSGVALIGSKLLSIKPRISVVDGKMMVTKKYIGNINTCLLKYCDDILNEVPANKKRVFVAYSSPIKVKDKIKEKLKNYGFEEIIEAKAGPSICIHCGENTLGILYISK